MDNFFLRTLVWIALFTFGYSLLSTWSEIILRGFLSDQKAIPMLVLTILGFVGFGVWAGQTRNIR